MQPIRAPLRQHIRCFMPHLRRRVGVHRASSLKNTHRDPPAFVQLKKRLPKLPQFVVIYSTDSLCTLSHYCQSLEGRPFLSSPPRRPSSITVLPNPEFRVPQLSSKTGRAHICASFIPHRSQPQGRAKSPWGPMKSWFS